MWTNRVRLDCHIILLYRQTLISSLSGYISVTLTGIIGLGCQIHISPVLIYNSLTKDMRYVSFHSVDYNPGLITTFFTELSWQQKELPPSETGWEGFHISLSIQVKKDLRPKVNCGAAEAGVLLPFFSGRKDCITSSCEICWGADKAALQRIINSTKNHTLPAHSGGQQASMLPSQWTKWMSWTALEVQIETRFLDCDGWRSFTDKHLSELEECIKMDILHVSQPQM